MTDEKQQIIALAIENFEQELKVALTVDEVNYYLTLLDLCYAEQERRAETHLCDSCAWECMAECPYSDKIEFGCGNGNDNVIKCENYINKTALYKYEHRIVREDSIIMDFVEREIASGRPDYRRP